MTVDGLFNVFSLLQDHAERSPRWLALAQATGRDKAGRFVYAVRTYGQLQADIEGLTRGLRAIGITKGSKTLVLVKPDLDLPVIVFSLFKIGAVPVIIDPAMGWTRLLACIRKVEPDAVIALPLIHALRPFLGDVFRTVKTFISNGSAWMPATHRLAHLRHASEGDAHTEPTLGTDLAAIFFTSGSTGTPKGVEVRHRNLGAQIAHFGALFPVDPQDVELAAFPVATLIGPCLGQTSVIPDMGSLHPGRCNPHNLVQTIEDFGITSGFASPIVWERLSRHCVAQGVRLSTIKRAFSGGAPIPYTMLARLAHLLPHGVMVTPYGATEVTPISSIDAREIERDTAALSASGHGTCVGRVVPGLTVKIIEIDAQRLPHWQDVTLLPDGVIGEIVVRGALVSQAYHNDPENTALAKIQADDGDQLDPVWHRTGDAGYFDAQGRLWCCGRIKHIVHADGQRYFSVPAEEILNAELEVWRSALVEVQVNGQAQLCMVVEFYPEHLAGIHAARIQAFKDKLHGFGFPVRHVLTYPHAFPVDRRHNSKIERHILARWAQLQLDKGVPS